MSEPTDEAVARAARRYVAALLGAELPERERERALLELVDLVAGAELGAVLAPGPLVCPVCDDGYTLEADAVCSVCNRYGSCSACREGDCSHMRTGAP